MLITPDHISEKTRALIRSASDAAFARQLRRANFVHRLMLVSLSVSVATLVFALATRSAGWWTVILPMMITVAFRRQVEQDEHAADVMKIALNPEVVAEIRRAGGNDA